MQQPRRWRLVALLLVMASPWAGSSAATSPCEAAVAVQALDDSLARIRRVYEGTLSVASDLECFRL